MELPRVFFLACGILFCALGIFEAAGQPSNVVTSPPIYVPDYSHANDPLPNGVLAWDAEQKTVEATNGQDLAWFDFAFTNVSTGPVTILNGHGSCSCTTVQLPETPWLIPVGGGGHIAISINLAGKKGLLFNYGIITTDKGTKSLILAVNIALPPPAEALSDEDRARGMAAAKVDRQAVFRGDCVNCHAKNVKGKYGSQLFAQTCAVCHEANPRATMVPDLHNLKVPTSTEFWRTWITSGKAGTLMPAFATSQGGPLDDRQIGSLAAFLDAAIPSQPPAPASK